MVVEVEHTLREIATRWRHTTRRRPAESTRRPANDQRRDCAGAKPAGSARTGTRQSAERSVEPAALRPPRTWVTALEHVLAVEMRAVAIASRDSMHDRRLLLVVEALERGKRRMGEKEAVERQRGPIAGRGKREIAVQVGVIRISDRRHG
jgi:hypothetical protein